MGLWNWIFHPIDSFKNMVKDKLNQAQDYVTGMMGGGSNNDNNQDNNQQQQNNNNSPPAGPTMGMKSNPQQQQNNDGTDQSNNNGGISDPNAKSNNQSNDQSNDQSKDNSGGGIWDSIKGFLGGGLGLVIGIILLLVKGIASLFGADLNLPSFDNPAGNVIQQTASKVENTVKTFVQPAVTWVKDKVHSAVDWVKSLFMGNKVNIDADGSSTAFNPNTAAGRQQILDSGPSGFVVADKNDKKSQKFTFSDGTTLNLKLNDNGSFVSKTSLENTAYDKGDQRRYVNSDTTPFMALSVQQAQQLGVKLGDKVEVTNVDNGMHTTAIYADSSGSNRAANHIEMSVAAARNLGVGVDARGYTDVDHMNLKVEAYANSSDPTKKRTIEVT